MIEFYPETKLVHVSAVIASGLLFFVRGLAVQLGGRWAMAAPLRYLSYLVDAHLGGGVPAAYHATNVALHALAGVLVSRLARRLGASALGALAAGLLFVSHPLAVEAVAYVSGRRDLLATLLGIAAVAAWASPRGLTMAAVFSLVSRSRPAADPGNGHQG